MRSSSEAEVEGMSDVNEQKISSLLQQGLELYGTGDVARAFLLWGEALQLDPGSMGPKLEAACQFVANTGAKAMIGSLDEARRVLQGLAGTLIQPGVDASTYPPTLHDRGENAAGQQHCCCHYR